MTAWSQHADSPATLHLLLDFHHVGLDGELLPIYLYSCRLILVQLLLQSEGILLCTLIPLCTERARIEALLSNLELTMWLTKNRHDRLLKQKHYGDHDVSTNRDHVVKSDHDAGGDDSAK